MFKSIFRRRIVYLGAFSIAGVILCSQDISVLAKINSHDRIEQTKMKLTQLPDRDILMQRLTSNQMFDVFIIGGGATGCGVAVDGAVKGLNIALVDRGDFSSGTSSKSTKLIHGGVRYLQNAVFKLDLDEYRLVREALYERKNIMENCPYLTNLIPIMIPIYSWWQVPYYWAGLKMYDLVAGSKLFRSSYILSKDKTLDEFPLINANKLYGSVVYYDGQMDDSRLNLMLAMTSIEYGATCLNYVEVVDMINHDDYIILHCMDVITGKTFECNARVVVNATGPFTDSTRRLYNKKEVDICRGASGTHIILPRYFCPKSMGLLDANTSDNRVLFMLPWNGHTLAGTTDNHCTISSNPKSTQQEIDFIVKELNKFLNPKIKIQTKDILSAWSGIRPLVMDANNHGNKDGTASISRSHFIENKGNFITIAGGKWTTYRSMADDVMKEAINSLEKLRNPKLSTKELNRIRQKSTANVKLYGSKYWTPYFYVSLIQNYNIAEDISKHLSSKYGIAALSIIGIAKQDGNNVILNRLDENFPYTIEEIRYCCRHEYVNTVVDVIARRLRLCFVDSFKAIYLLEKIVDIMADELNWDNDRKKIEIEAAKSYIKYDSGLDLLEKQSILNTTGNTHRNVANK